MNNFSIYFFFPDGDLGAYGKSRACYFKQKHRMVWERRHGPVGSGMKDSEAGQGHESE